MSEGELAVLRALRAHPAGLLQDDFREATRRAVSRHTVGVHLAVLLARGLIFSAPEHPTDARIKGSVERYKLTEVGESVLVQKDAETCE